MAKNIFHGFYDEIYSQDFDVKGIPYCWIQWKGTNVCMDFHCKCGFHGHVDAHACYNLICPKCHRKYAVGQNIKLIELTKEQALDVPSDGWRTDVDYEEQMLLPEWLKE